MTSDYDPSSIQVLRDGEHIRKRPQMYLGTELSDPRILNRFVEDSLCLALDQVVEGQCTEIGVAVHPGGTVPVRDNGRGLPMEPDEHENILAEVLLTKVGACRARKRSGRAMAACCHLGLVVVNVLSAWLRVRVFRDGVCWLQEYRCGEPQFPFRRASEAVETGLELSFQPDPALFGQLEFDGLELAKWFPSAGVRFGSLELLLGDVTKNQPTALHFTGVYATGEQ